MSYAPDNQMLIVFSVSSGVEEQEDSSEDPAPDNQTTDTHVTDLTEGNAEHKVKLSPARRCIVALN